MSATDYGGRGLPTLQRATRRSVIRLKGWQPFFSKAESPRNKMRCLACLYIVILYGPFKYVIPFPMSLTPQHLRLPTVDCRLLTPDSRLTTPVNYLPLYHCHFNINILVENYNVCIFAFNQGAFFILYFHNAGGCFCNHVHSIR